jgi:HD-like signal output (HDOD) protein
MMTFAQRRNITLPVFSNVAMQLQEASRSDSYDISAIEHAIDSDPALAAEVLRAANSAFFGGLSEVKTIRAAITRLGLKEVANLAFMATEKNRYTAQQPHIAKMLKTLWQHASACALASGWIAKRMRFAQLAEEAFIGGLLHDVGKLYLLRILDEMVGEHPRYSQYPVELVHEVLSQAHTEHGHRLLHSWNLPAIYLTIVKDHHDDLIDTANVPLLIVRLANHACNKTGMGLRCDDTIVLAATGEAAALGMSEVALAELEIILEDVQPLAA